MYPLEDGRRASGGGLDTPGHIYTLPSSCAKQPADYGGMSGRKPSKPRNVFSEHDRWAGLNRELRENSVPGPGAYG